MLTNRQTNGGWSHLYTISSPRSISFGTLKTFFYSTMYDMRLHFVRPGAYLGQLRVILPTLTSF